MSTLPCVSEHLEGVSVEVPGTRDDELWSSSSRPLERINAMTTTSMSDSLDTWLGSRLKKLSVSATPWLPVGAWASRARAAARINPDMILTAELSRTFVLECLG